MDPIKPRLTGAQIAANVAAMQSQGAPDDDIEHYLQSQGVQPTSAAAPAAAQLHADYKSGALAQRMAGANADDAADAQGPGYGMRLLTHIINAGQGIPGVEAVEAGAGALGSQFTSHPMSYDQSLNTLRDATGQIGGLTSMGEKAMGSLAIAPWLPKNPALAGAALGGADQALGADDESLAMRAGRTALGAGVGRLFGGLADHAITAITSKFSPTLGANFLSRLSDRAADAGRNYTRALDEGQGRTNTPAIQSILQRPVVADIVSGLLQTQKFAGKQATDPEVLDAVYHVLSDQAGALKTKVGRAMKLGKGNSLGRYDLSDVAQHQEDLIDAMSGGSSAPGPMPSYRTAVKDYADASRQLNAFKQGAAQIPSAAGAAPEVLKGTQRLSPEGFAAWAQQQTPTAQDAAAQGVKSALKSVPSYKAVKLLGLPIGMQATDALSRAPGLLRSVDPNASNKALGLLLSLHSLAQ